MFIMDKTQAGKCVDKSDVDVAYKEVGSGQQGGTSTVDCKVRQCFSIKREDDPRSKLECCAKKGTRAGEISWGTTPNVHLKAVDHFQPGHDPESKIRFPYTIDVRINRG